MYTIIVADDEEELRKALIRKVDWKKIGFEVVGEAENGIEALELVEKYQPDLLLTDIRMPFVNGIELARQVREVCPATNIAFLSGYDDFSYAKQAIQYNIISYMLKPISATELTKELMQIKDKIDEKYLLFASAEKKEKQTEIEVREFVLPLLLDEFQVAEEERSSRLFQKAVSCGMLKESCGDIYYTVVVTSILDEDQQNITEQVHMGAINSILEKYVKYVSFFMEEKVISILFAPKGTLEKYTHILVEEISQSITRILKKTGIMGVSRSSKNLTGLHELYVDAMNAISYSERNKRSVCYIADIERTEKVDFEKIQILIAELGRHIRGGSEEELQNCIQGFFQWAEKEKLSTVFYYVITNQIISEVLRIVYVVVKNENVSGFQELLGMQGMLQQKKTEELQKGCILFCMAAKELICEQRKKSSTRLCEYAKEIIEEKYMDQELSLVSVSEEIAVSPNYLSALIKRDTGSTFIDLLSKKRIQVAKELLLCTDLKVKEIAEKCGYNDQHYFSYCFKKYTGVSPNTCRRNSQEHMEWQKR